MSPSGPSRLQSLSTWFIWAGLTSCAVLFAWLNAGAGEAMLRFWPGLDPHPFPLVLVVFGSFLSGFLLTAVLMSVSSLRGGADQRALRRRITGLEQELQRLRNLPIEEDLHAPPESEPGESETA